MRAEIQSHADTDRMGRGRGGAKECRGQLGQLGAAAQRRRDGAIPFLPPPLTSLLVVVVPPRCRHSCSRTTAASSFPLPVLFPPSRCSRPAARRFLRGPRCSARPWAAPVPLLGQHHLFQCLSPPPSPPSPPSSPLPPLPLPRVALRRHRASARRAARRFARRGALRRAGRRRRCGRGARRRTRRCFPRSARRSSSI